MCLFVCLFVCLFLRGALTTDGAHIRRGLKLKACWFCFNMRLIKLVSEKSPQISLINTPCMHIKKIAFGHYEILIVREFEYFCYRNL